MDRILNNLPKGQFVIFVFVQEEEFRSLCEKSLGSLVKGQPAELEALFSLQALVHRYNQYSIHLSNPRQVAASRARGFVCTSSFGAYVQLVIYLSIYLSTYLSILSIYLSLSLYCRGVAGLSQFSRKLTNQYSIYIENLVFLVCHYLIIYPSSVVDPVIPYTLAGSVLCIGKMDQVPVLYIYLSRLEHPRGILAQLFMSLFYLNIYLDLSIVQSIECGGVYVRLSLDN